MKKNPNLIQLLESFALTALLAFFLFFMRRGEDAFFALTLGFSAYAFLFSMLMIYIDGDKSDRGMCKLLPIARSDLAFYGLLVEYALSVLFAIVHSQSDINIPTMAVIYAIPPIFMLTVILIPTPKEAPLPPPANEGGNVKSKSLIGYAAILRKLIQKCEYESLSTIMEKTADLLLRLDTDFSVQLDTLENDISHKCVKIENALLTHNTSQLFLLERELSATVELIEKRCASYTYCLSDEGFYQIHDEIAMEQIDRLLDKMGLEYEEDLPKLNTPIEGEFFYKKALKFASDEYAALLRSYNDQIVEKLEKETASRAVRAKKRQSFLRIGAQTVTLLLVVVMAGVTLLWHTLLQPNGLIISENDDGTLSVIGYNPIYGDELVIPETVRGKRVTTVGKEALMGSSLRSLELSEGIETIDYQAIRDCAMLEELILPKSLGTIGNYAFKADDLLTKVCYRGSEDDWKKVTVGTLGNDEFKRLEVEFDYQG